MSQTERDRLKVLHEVRQGKLTQVLAAQQLQLSARQVRRLLAKMKQDGDRAVVHGLRGKRSNRRIDDKIVAKGRIERCFGTLQDRLVKQLRLAGARTIDEANVALEAFLEDWNERFTMTAANPTDAHRPLSAEHNLDAALSRVEQRRVENNYTVQFRGKRYQIAKSHVRVGMRGEQVRVEERLDGM